MWKKLKGMHSGLLCVVLREAGGGTDSQISSSLKTTAPGNLAGVQLYCRPGGTLARAAGPGEPTEAGETRRD